MLVHGECDEVLRDRLEAAWCPGSGFLVSSKALDTVGGFPETSIAEDVLFSWILQGQGWKTVYVNEKLQWGLQPNSLASHIGQRTKWVSQEISLLSKELANSLLVRWTHQQLLGTGLLHSPSAHQGDE